MNDADSSILRRLPPRQHEGLTMNDPFDYSPHPLCQEAAGLAMPDIGRLMEGQSEGKMFGVLVVEPRQQEGASAELGFLVGYSGQIDGRSDWPGFVPAVFDYLQADGYFKQEEARITAINGEVDRLEQQPQRLQALQRLAEAREAAQREVDEMQRSVVEARERRRTVRAQRQLDADEESALVRESQFQKAELRRLKKRHAAAIEVLAVASEQFEEPIRRLKDERRRRSDALQRWLFEHFVMLNAEGRRRHLMDIFSETTLGVPPAGAGECCEPKLLQWAYAHGLRPLQMAMFWVGPSPKVEIRHEGRYYPACRGKCLPILRWMLGSTPADDHPSERSVEVPILYEDDDMVAVDKPAGLLSVPGIAEKQSVWSIMAQRYADTAVPLMVHRLDQPTSGVLLMAKTKAAQRQLQRQFMAHEVRKRYVALLERESVGIEQLERLSHGPAAPDGPLLTIDLPLWGDPLNRPYRCVDAERGKAAVTKVQLLQPCGGRLRVALYPLTGRTHQLRVHCAHSLGLGNPILGDNLYGSVAASRLYLHAESICFNHPRTGKRMTISAPVPF